MTESKNENDHFDLDHFDHNFGHSLFHSPPYFAYRVEFDILEQFVLDGVVLTLSHCIVLRVSAFCHTDLNAGIDKQRSICGTDILDTPFRLQSYLTYFPL